MTVSRPLDRIIAGRVPLRVIRTLARSPTKEFTGRELAGEANVSPSKAIAALNVLLEEGLVERRTAGPSQLWRFRPGHRLAGTLRALFDAEASVERDLEDGLASGLKGVPGIERVVLFGSTARGEATAGSDVDLLVVVRTERAKARVEAVLDLLRAEVQERFGKRLAPILYTTRQWKAKGALPLKRNIEREGRILAGVGP